MWKMLLGRLAKLEVPAEARRTATPVGRKCRAEFVKVLFIENANGEPCLAGMSQRHGGTAYRVGEIVYPDEYDDDIRVECTHGIHFFLTRAEAEEWTG